MTRESDRLPSLGSFWDGDGVHFSIFSENATKVELCLFDSCQAQIESRRISLGKRDGHIWSAYVEGIAPGALYGYRIYGPNDPPLGNRFNPAKIVVDPYAKSLGRPLKWTTDLSYPIYGMDTSDNAAQAALCKVIDPAFSWGDDSPPAIPWNETIIYETHVKGMTCLNPDVPKNLRGRYGGFASKPVIEHLVNLGITAVEFLPVQQKADEYSLFQKGLSNYWGYNPLLFFAPELSFAVSDPVKEFKEMVRALHSAGIEVILDMVFNHTAEGDRFGPTLSFRGIDNRVYYRLDEENPELYKNFTGCGNTFDANHPTAVKLILDCLRYWVQEMHVDGFRFDLASALIRGDQGMEQPSLFLEAIENDPILKNVKLIAEPWDLGEDGYQLSSFPSPWSEWNDQYRQTMRQFWLGEKGISGLFARRVSGSGDIYKPKNRLPYSSTNYVTCHDGFTLHDLVSYRQKHNLENKENNKDGVNENFSCNHGAEGPTQNPGINKLRQRQKRNLITTLMISLGTPMVSGGDELGHSQRGNNNAYSQDNEISWLDWDLDENQEKFLNFMRRVIQIRKENPALHQNNFFDGKSDYDNQKDVTWLAPSGRELCGPDWEDGSPATIGFMLKNRKISGECEPLLILANPEEREINFELPETEKEFRWITLLDTAKTEEDKSSESTIISGPFSLLDRSLKILRKVK